MRQVVVLYNCDYDEELLQQEGVDVSAVRASALAICDALRACGIRAELVGAGGPDIFDVIEDLRARAPDLVFNLCESLRGDVRNEVVVPSLLEMLGIPYTGAGALALGMCLHKERTKDVLLARAIATPAYRVVRALGDLDDLGVELPVFLKLAHEDASIGIDASNVARDRDGLQARAAALLNTYRQPVIAERFIAGREVNVTLIGHGDDVDVLPLHEIDFSGMPPDRPHIVTYAAKWDEHHVDYAGTTPVPMRDCPPDLARAIETTARAAYRALGLRDYGRVDVRVDDDGTVWVIDVNPNCDISPDAGYARAARAAGIAYPALIGRICEVAWRRYADDAASARVD